ncbi:MAG: hypothetical protein GF401_20455 [Chitinivibrionales bacterium]|nr:hypothetical protein [Chitinivibrionales bacterium]
MKLTRVSLDQVKKIALPIMSNGYAKRNKLRSSAEEKNVLEKNFHVTSDLAQTLTSALSKLKDHFQNDIEMLHSAASLVISSILNESRISCAIVGGQSAAYCKHWYSHWYNKKL